MNSEISRIALDAMGGDRAPRETVRGAVRAVLADPKLCVVLVGDQAKVEAELAPLNAPSDRLEIVHASQVIGSGESPVEGLRSKPDASIKRAAELVRDGRAEGLVGAGNTGAAVACGTLVLRLIPGVRRPGIAAPMPSRDGGLTILCDVGANIHCKPLHLYHYGILAARYAERLYDISHPTIGLLNIGEEEGKGTGLVKETSRLFAQGGVNYIGNVEGNDVFSGRCDVIVCEGFVGNVVLKTAEGLFEAIASRIKGFLGELASSGSASGGGSDALFKSFGARLDWAEHGGAPLLGVNGLVLISHGRSDERAIYNALLQAARLQRRGMLAEMTHDIEASESGSAP